MKITLLVTGKTRERYLQDGIAEYLKRLGRYGGIEYRELPDVRVKNLTEVQVCEKEAEGILRSLPSQDGIILLDEKGRDYSSQGLADWLEQKMNAGTRHLSFLVGGPYGFAPVIREQASEMISLSRLTFSHQMVRLIFLEQLYRAFTIIKGEPYHHA